jgi:hypothetical protein
MARPIQADPTDRIRLIPTKSKEQVSKSKGRKEISA